MQSGSMELTLQIMMVGAVVCLAAFFLGMPLTHSTQNPRDVPARELYRRRVGA